ncbi:AAA family ATPase [Kineosporia rhizophila]|uniref:AAA family ATPase n=1 Tax=Kineosporia rhizophila TaxID=84633 RepID=UPI000A7C18AB|nr:ATP-binding protein [Kineosporia rhizophila]MCE0534375.1 AAA family ATPase [Kineosporia rhizophila]
MKLVSVELREYRNLKDFQVLFDSHESTTVLIGGNGTGKSHLLEALVEIFRDLEARNPSSFQYVVRYTCRGHDVVIDCEPSRASGKIKARVDGKPLTWKKLQANLDEYLPSYVFAYYSGWSSRLERHFDEPTRRHYTAIMGSSRGELPLRRMFFCRQEYSQLVLLAFFLAPREIAETVLRKYLEIESFDSALFVLKKPWWGARSKPSRAQLADGDPRYWYARGAFRSFLDRLWGAALAPIRATENIARDVRRNPEPTERQFLYVKDLAALALLKDEADAPKTVFGYLESLFLCDLMDEVRVTVKRRDGSRVKFSQMSEGEQQLLTVLGLMLFTRNDESLYLLDEPDTHLNPVWTYEYLSLLQDSIKADKGHLLVATHNPLMVGGLVREQVRRFSREQVQDLPSPSEGTEEQLEIFAEDAEREPRDLVETSVDLDRPSVVKTKSVAFEPDYDPIGLGIEGLLKSELYGLRSTLAPEVLELLDEQYRLLGEKESTAQQRDRLREVSAELHRMAIIHTFPNPYFSAFAAALARRQPAPNTRLTQAALIEQARLSDEILDELLSEDEASDNRA